MGLLHVPVFETNEVPPISSTHLLVMGGTMSVNDEEKLPWLKTEKQIIRERVMKGQPVLGICLGAQMIASSFGAAVYPCEPELGWSSVTAVNMAMFPELPGQFRVFQMHGETFDIPEEAALIYRGENVPSQALCMGSALGLQFHIELTLEMIQDWISIVQCRNNPTISPRAGTISRKAGRSAEVLQTVSCLPPHLVFMAAAGRVRKGDLGFSRFRADGGGAEPEGMAVARIMEQLHAVSRAKVERNGDRD